MGILSTNYPIRHRVVNGPYTVSQYDETADETQEIYKGKSYSPGTESDLDLSEITRYHLNTKKITLPPFGDPVVHNTLNVKQNFNSVWYANGKWLAVGENGLIANSTDGINWNCKYNESRINFYSIVYGNETWVIGGSNTTTGYSLDNGLTWEFMSHSYFSSGIRDLTYANGLFIFYNSQGVLSSSDGIHWHQSDPLGGSYGYNKSYYAGKGWHMLGYDGYMLYSDDNGLNWRLTKSGSTTRYEAVKVGDIFYVIGNNNSRGTVESTTDFINFQTIWTGKNPYNRIAYGNNIWVVAGHTGYIAYTTDLADWQETQISDRTLTSVHFNNNKFTFVGNLISGVSTNGFDWKISFYDYWNFITYLNESYIGTTGESRIAYSADGINWNYSQVGSINGRWEDMAYGNNLYVAVGLSYRYNGDYLYNIALSTDGKNWTPYLVEPIGNVRRYGITFAQDKFISVGNNGIQYSTDGLNWTTAWDDIPDYGELNSVVYENDIFIVCGQKSQIYYSYDGINWKPADIEIYNTYNHYSATAFGNGIWITVGSSGTKILHSIDNGITWKFITNTSHKFNDITYDGNRFIAVGDKEIGYSVDGLNWEFEEHPETINSIYAKDNTLILAGNYFYEFRNVDYGIATQDTGMIADFVIDNNSRMYTVGYDYNTEGIEDIGYNRINNDPISNELIEGGYATLSFYDAQVSNNKEITVTLNGRKLISDQSHYRATQFYFFTEGVQAQPGDTLTLSIESNGQTYSVDYQFIDNPEDHRYAIYYVNKLGGVDGLLLKGRVDESFTNSSYQISTPFDKSDPANFQNQTVQNTAKRKFSINTGFLTDQQSGRMDHLMLSPKVWLFDIRENKRYACTIKSNSFTRKNFRNGHKLVNYTLELEQSQEIIRRS